MNIDEGLLTDEELAEIAEEFKKLYPTSSDMILWRNFRLRKQCLKLLEWLKGICIEHDHVKIVGSIEDYKDAGCPQFRRMECPECMSELESNLKEGR